MARPRTPTAVLEARGAFKKNPQRRKARENEPQVVSGLGPAPEWLSAKRRLVWAEIAGQAYWLTAADRLTVELTVALMVSFREGTISSEQLNTLTRLLAQLGLNPSGRARVQAPKQPEKEEDNPFAAFK